MKNCIVQKKVHKLTHYRLTYAQVYTNFAKHSPDLNGFISFSKETIKKMFPEFILVEEILTGRLKLEENEKMLIHSKRKMTFKQEVYLVKILINMKVQKEAHWT